MDIVLDISKSVEQNAESYYEKAKRYKKKIPGIKKTIETHKAKLESLEKESAAAIAQAGPGGRRMAKKKEWYEKFRWFISSDGFLVIGGRDATTNDIIVKKHTDQDDTVFHTELPGSPFVIIKNPDSSTIPEQTVMEAAIFCGSYSKSWKSERTSAEVYHVKPSQLSKEVPAGMAGLSKGAFMVYGKRNFMNPVLNIAVCNNDGRIMAGPLSAIKKHCEKSRAEYVEIIPGSDKLSDVAKKIQKITGGDLDEIIRALPSQCSIKGKKR